MDQNELIKKIKAYTNNGFIAEAQTMSFQKFLSTVSLSNKSVEEALVNVTNSLGIQIKNDIQFYLSDKQKSSPRDVPVIKPTHLKDFESIADLQKRIKELPSEWTVIQVTRELNVCDVVGLSPEHTRADPTIVLSRFPCGNMLKRVQPYMVTIPPPENQVIGPNITERLHDLMKMRREYYNNPLNKKSQSVYNSSESGLASCLNELESYWLREHQFLFGGRIVNEVLEKHLWKKAESLLDEVQSSNKKNRERSVDMLYQLILSTHLLKPAELAKAIKFILYDSEYSACNADEVALCMDQIKTLNSSKDVRKVQRYPVILIIEPSLEILPWEMTKVLSGHPVSRILSLHFLYAVFKYHEPNIHNGYRHLPVNSGFCLLNPDKSLESCQKRVGEFLKNDLSWIQVEAGTVPEPNALVDCLNKFSMYLYCGHGSGSQYFKSGSLKTTPVNGVVMLYGCSSNLPRGRGGRTPYSNDTYAYLSNGCPCIVGALYDIGTADADRAAIKTLSSMLPTVSRDGVATLSDPIEPNVLQAVQLGKSDCHSFWTKCSFLARGIPVKIICADSEKASISQLLQRTEMEGSLEKIRRIVSFCRIFGVHQIIYDRGTKKFHSSTTSILYSCVISLILLSPLFMRLLCPHLFWKDDDAAMQWGHIYWRFIGAMWDIFLIVCGLTSWKSQCRVLNSLFAMMEKVSRTTGSFSISIKWYTAAIVFFAVLMIITNMGNEYISIVDTLTNAYFMIFVYYFGIHVLCVAEATCRLNESLELNYNIHPRRSEAKKFDGWVANMETEFIKLRQDGVVGLRTEELVQKYCILYHDIFDVSRQINEVFGVALLGMTLHLGITSLVSSYYVFVFYPCTTWERLSVEIGNVGWLVTGIGCLAILIHPCQKTAIKSNQTMQILNNFTVSCVEDADVIYELSKFRTIIQSEEIEFSPLGMLRLNYTLILTVLGTSVSYLVIMAQTSVADCMAYVHEHEDYDDLGSP